MMKVDTKAILTVEADAVEQVGQEYVELFMENGFMNEEELYTLRNVYLNEAYTHVRVFFGNQHIDHFIASACTMTQHAVYQGGMCEVRTIEGIMPIQGRVKVGIVDDMKNLNNGEETTYKLDRGFFDWKQFTATESMEYKSQKYRDNKAEFTPKKRYFNVFIPQSRLTKSTHGNVLSELGNVIGKQK